MTPGREQPVMYAMLRTHTTASEAAAGLRSAVAGIDSLVPITRVRALDEVVATSVAAPRALAMLLVGFGGLAVIIGAVGVYSLISYMVSWRTREIGLRLALGAQRWQIVLSVVRQSLILAGAGCVIGLAGSVALSRLLHSFLFEVSALDPVTFCLIPLLMALVALVAAWIPARRAAAVDPMEALTSRLGGRNAKNACLMVQVPRDVLAARIGEEFDAELEAHLAKQDMTKAFDRG